MFHVVVFLQVFAFVVLRCLVRLCLLNRCLFSPICHLCFLNLYKIIKGYERYSCFVGGSNAWVMVAC